MGPAVKTLISLAGSTTRLYRSLPLHLDTVTASLPSSENNMGTLQLLFRFFMQFWESVLTSSHLVPTHLFLFNQYFHLKLFSVILIKLKILLRQLWHVSYNIPADICIKYFALVLQLHFEWIPNLDSNTHWRTDWH